MIERTICLLAGDVLPEVFVPHLLVHCDLMVRLAEQERLGEIFGCRVNLRTQFEERLTPDGALKGMQFMATVRDRNNQRFAWTFLATEFDKNLIGAAIWEEVNRNLPHTTRPRYS